MTAGKRRLWKTWAALAAVWACVAAFWHGGTVCRAAEDIAVRDERAEAAYWTRRNADGDETLFTPEEIERMNRALRRADDTLVSLAAYPEVLSGAAVREKIGRAMQDFAEDELPELYRGGVLLTEDGFWRAKQNCGLERIAERVPVRWAVTTERLNLRLLPRAEGWFETPGDTRYDMLQGTAVDPAEPAAVLAQSEDGAFAFVETRYYAGWVSRHGLAFTDRAAWTKYVEPDDFLVVTAPKKWIDVGGAWRVLFQMGSRLPLRAPRPEDGAWRASAPVSVNGVLNEAEVRVADDDTVHRGWLPCTENTFLRQAFRFLGDVYGWGGLEESVDCSAFAADVYRSMGIELPRDADRQEAAMPGYVRLDDMDAPRRLAAVRDAPPGALLFKPGHVMLYLGADEDGEPMAIHAISSYFTFARGYAQKRYIRRVAVTDLRYLDSRGDEALDAMTGVGFMAGGEE